jgi:bacillithiol synthase
MSYKIFHIDYKETGLFSKTFNSYLGGDSKLSPFYQYQPSVSGFSEAIKETGKYNYDRKLLSNSLKEYYTKNASENISDATLKNIQKLEDGNCFTVTTGHQLCLFTGPLYFIYKIITAINLSEKLNKEYPDKHFVPVYWMASEDHDFAEINHAYVFGEKVEWSMDPMNAPVGKLSLNSLASTMEALYAIMSDGENGADLKRLISECYGGEKTLAQATFLFVNALLGKYGLVILEPDNTSFKNIFSSIITDELLNSNTFKLVSNTNRKLIEAGVEPQVNPREINLFYIDENGRNRIEKKNDKFEIVNTAKSFTQGEITDLIKESPERFSPNVLLRPIYQQCILPNVAYVGGPSEIVYWLQLKDIFTHYKVPFPVLMPRNSALVISAPIAQKMDKLGLDTKAIFGDTESLIKQFITKISDGLPDFEKVGGELRNIYASLANKVQETDPTLVASTEAELQKQINALKTLETKLIRVKKQKEETSVAKIHKIKGILFPNGALQDRMDNFIPFYLQHGPAFFDLLKENFDPFEFSVTVLREE